MSIKKQNLHWDLKLALTLKHMQLKDFAESVVRPNGVRGVSHTAVIRVAQHHESTPWLRDAIKNFIADSKRENPSFWQNMEVAGERR